MIRRGNILFDFLSSPPLLLINARIHVLTVERVPFRNTDWCGDRRQKETDRSVSSSSWRLAVETPDKVLSSSSSSPVGSYFLSCWLLLIYLKPVGVLCRLLDKPIIWTRSFLLTLVIKTVDYFSFLFFLSLNSFLSGVITQRVWTTNWRYCPDKIPITHIEFSMLNQGQLSLCMNCGIWIGGKTITLNEWIRVFESTVNKNVIRKTRTRPSQSPSSGAAPHKQENPAHYVTRRPIQCIDSVYSVYQQYRWAEM